MDKSFIWDSRWSGEKCPYSEWVGIWNHNFVKDTDLVPLNYDCKGVL